jgi:NTE family protein
MSTPRLGLALGSGGARGLAHCGVLDAFAEAGLPIDVVGGTSMGSLVGALYARRPDPATVWRELHDYVEDSEFADYWAAFVPRRDGDERGEARPWHGFFDYMHRGRVALRTMATRSAESREKLAAPLQRLLGTTRTFADLQLPFAAVALDLVSGRSVVYSDGPLLEALYASCAIPGVFPPIESNGRLIVDGGGPYRVPVEAVRELGADFVVAVDIPSYLEPRLRTGFDLGMRSNSIARDRLNELVCATADALIRPPVELFHWADFRSGEAIRDLGYQAARAALPEIERSWRRHGSPLRRVADLVRLRPRRSA